MPITSLITTGDWNSVEHLSTEPYCCKVQVTAVGINTEWGLLMASISEDSGEETPLQV
jgi:magnesium-transporting ATPase (P-type)